VTATVSIPLETWLVITGAERWYLGVAVTEADTLALPVTVTEPAGTLTEIPRRRYAAGVHMQWTLQPRFNRADRDTKCDGGSLQVKTSQVPLLTNTARPPLLPHRPSTLAAT